MHHATTVRKARRLLTCRSIFCCGTRIPEILSVDGKSSLGTFVGGRQVVISPSAFSLSSPAPPSEITEYWLSVFLLRPVQELGTLYLGALNTRTELFEFRENGLDSYGYVVGFCRTSRYSESVFPNISMYLGRRGIRRSTDPARGLKPFVSSETFYDGRCSSLDVFCETSLGSWHCRIDDAQCSQRHFKREENFLAVVHAGHQLSRGRSEGLYLGGNIHHTGNPGEGMDLPERNFGKRSCRLWKPRHRDIATHLGRYQRIEPTP